MNSPFIIVLLSMLTFMLLTYNAYAQSGYISDPSGNQYPTIKLEGKLWLAKNLNYSMKGSRCYEDKPENCEKYGRLYNWDAAQKACRALGQRWRLPSDDDWWNMISLFGTAFNNLQYQEQNGNYNISGKAAYLALIEGGYSDFQGKRGGYFNSPRTFSQLEEVGWYWASTEYKPDNMAWLYGFSSPYLIRSRFLKSSAFSCRCVKD